MTNPSGSSFVSLQTVCDLTLVVEYHNDVNEVVKRMIHETGLSAKSPDADARR